MRLEFTDEEMECVRDGISDAVHLLLTPKGEGLTVAEPHLKAVYKSLWTAEAVLVDKIGAATSPLRARMSRHRGELLPNDLVDPEYTCAACGRAEASCSADPCATVLREREE